MKSYQFDIELFQGYMCPGIPVTEDLSIEVEFSDEEVSKIRQLVKDYTGDKGAGLMPILLNDAPELHERIAKAAFQKSMISISSTASATMVSCWMRTINDATSKRI